MKSPMLAMTMAFTIVFMGLFYDTPSAAQGCPAPGFKTAVAFDTAGVDSYSVTVGDFNGDGKPDLAVANNGVFGFFSYVPDTVSVLLGKGDGTFQAAVSYSVGNGPASVAWGDFNHDGRLDLVTANHIDGTVSILKGNGDGTFQAGVDYAAGTSPISVAVGDLNGDGITDLVTANFDSTGGVSVLLGNGDGTFKAPVTYAAGTYLTAMALGDFNGDGKLDLAVPQYNSKSVAVLLGNGDGTFQSAVSYPAGTYPRAVAVGDFNGDGKLDVAVALNSGSATVLLGNGDGSFQTPASYNLGGSPDCIATGDFNGDGKLDIAIANYAGFVSILQGKGDGTFLPAINLSVVSTNNPESIAVADLNADGSLDLAVAVSVNAGVAVSNGNNVTVLLNTCTAPVPSLSILQSASTLTVSWAFPSTGFVLESTTSLATPNWQPAPEMLATNNGQLVVTTSLGTSQRYFRLHKPSTISP